MIQNSKGNPWPSSPRSETIYQAHAKQRWHVLNNTEFSGYSQGFSRVAGGLASDRKSKKIKFFGLFPAILVLHCARRKFVMRLKK